MAGGAFIFSGLASLRFIFAICHRVFREENFMDRLREKGGVEGSRTGKRERQVERSQYLDIDLRECAGSLWSHRTRNGDDGV